MHGFSVRALACRAHVGTRWTGFSPQTRLKLAADNVQSMVIPGTGHFVAEEAPEELLAGLTAFLAPYRDGAAASAR